MSLQQRELAWEPADAELATIADPRPATWPRARLVSATMTLLVAAALVLPWTLTRDDAVPVELLAIPAVIAVIVTRWLFDSRAVRVHGRVSPRALIATVPPAVAGSGLVALCVVVLGASLQPLAWVASLGATCAALATAAALRSVEVRYWRASRRIFLVASEASRRDIAHEIWRHQAMELVGHSSGDQGATLDASLAACRPTMLVLSSSAIRDEDVVAAALRFNLAGGRVRDLGSFYEQHFKKVPLDDLTPSWFLFDISEIHRHRTYVAAKRAGEVALSSLLLIALAPLLALLALIVLLSSGRPVLFRHSRVGKDNRPFTLVKFRTMKGSSEGPADWATGHATRITGAGRFLRRYQLDELPQLYNVLRGDMSLVGPRPEQVPLVRELEARIPYYGARHRVRPGLTGWAQIHRGDGESYDGGLQKLQYDFFYIKHQSLRLDGLILLATLQAVLRDYAE